MVAPVSITLPWPALGCGRRQNIGDQIRLGDMTTVAAPSRAAWLGKSCMRRGACTLRYSLRRFSLAGCFVFEAADGVLNLAFNLVGFSFGFELGIARRLADHLLD